MKANRKVIIPAIVIGLISLALLIYYYYSMPARPQHLPGQGRPPEGFRKKDEGLDLTILGNIAIACGAISFLWFRFKKKLTSPSPLVKKTAKKLYAVHTFFGWAALILVAVHGGYYLITDISNHNIWSGLAAFLLLLVLAVYGYLYKKVRNKFMRATHFVLSLGWIVTLIVHAGGFLGFCIGATIVIYIVLWFIENAAKKRAIA